MTIGDVWLDGNIIFVGLLGRDAVGNVGAFTSSVYIYLTHPVLGNLSSSCIPNGGPCVATIAPPSSWFTSTTNVTVSFGLSVATSRILLSGPSSLRLNAAPILTVSNNIVIQIPHRVLYPGDTFNAYVYGNSSKAMSLFTLTFSTPVGINIITLSYSKSIWQATVNSNTPQQWAIVASPAQPGSVSGLNTLCTIGLQVDPAATVDQIYAFTSLIQTFTDGTNTAILPNGYTTPTAATFLDRSGYSSTGSLYIGSVFYSSLLAYTPRAEFVNTAILGDATIKSTMTVYKASSLGTFVVTSANCSSSNSAVIQVTPSCSYIYINGSETSGGSVTFTVSAPGVSSYAFSARSWAPQIPVTINVLDTTLNLIPGYYNSGNNCSQMYQASTVTAAVVFNRSLTDVMTVILPATSPLLAASLVSASPSIASINLVNGQLMVQGISLGSTVLSYKVGSTVIGTVSINVSSSPVSISRLRVVIYQSGSVFLNTTSPIALMSATNALTYSVTNLLTQELQLASIEVYAIFNDSGSPLYLTPTLGLQLASLNPAIVDIPSWQTIRARSTGTGMLITATWNPPTCSSGILGSGLGQVFVSLPPATGATISVTTPTLVPAGDPSINVGYTTSTYFSVVLNYPGGVTKAMTTDNRFVNFVHFPGMPHSIIAGLYLMP